MNRIFAYRLMLVVTVIASLISNHNIQYLQTVIAPIGVVNAETPAYFRINMTINIDIRDDRRPMLENLPCMDPRDVHSGRW